MLKNKIFGKVKIFKGNIFFVFWSKVLDKINSADKINSVPDRKILLKNNYI